MTQDRKFQLVRLSLAKSLTQASDIVGTKEPSDPSQRYLAG